MSTTKRRDASHGQTPMQNLSKGIHRKGARPTMTPEEFYAKLNQKIAEVNRLNAKSKENS